MQPYLLTLLAIYTKFPTAKASNIAQKMGLPTEMVKKARKVLVDSNMLIRDHSGQWYVTFLGKTALSKLDVDKSKENLRTMQKAIKIICDALQVLPSDLEHFHLMDKGMTNDSYVFTSKGKRYIYRRAGQGSEMLVDRYREYANYLVLDGRGISDVVLYHNPIDGTKITRFIEDNESLDFHNENHLQLALEALRNLHSQDIKSPHIFDFKERLDYYEHICHSNEVTFYPTYKKYKARVLHLLDLVEKLNVPKCFCHIDFVPGNCLITKDGKVVLIDWEYSGEQDPIVDIAMFCISASFNKIQSDKLLKNYLKRQPTLEEFARFYTYIATAGLMWSLWSEYKTSCGEIFEGYTDRVYKLCMKYSDLAQSIFDRVSFLNSAN